jgi:hypothetical protein
MDRPVVGDQFESFSCSPASYLTQSTAEVNTAGMAGKHVLAGAMTDGTGQ